MSRMSQVEAGFCRSAPWRAFARHVVLPWALDGRTLEGDCLEIGAGSGAMAEELLKREKRIRLTALDVDPTMTHVARQRLDRFGTRAAVATGDATELPYDNQSHDYVLSWLMLHHTVEWERSLSEIHRVLKPGGMLIGYDLLDTGPARLFHRLDRSEHQLFGADHLQQTLAADFADEVQVDRKLGGLVCRFTARA